MLEKNYRATLIIPAYQEELGIKSVLDELINIKNNNNFIDQIIVVDDGSTDKTSEIILSYPGIELIKHSVNRGYGASLKTGIINAKNDIIIIIKTIVIIL